MSKIPSGFFVHKGKLFKNDFKGHKGRPGQVGGSQPMGTSSPRSSPKGSGTGETSSTEKSNSVPLTKKGFRIADTRENDIGGKSTTYFKGKIYQGDGIVVHKDWSGQVKEVSVISGYRSATKKPFTSIKEALDYLSGK